MNSRFTMLVLGLLASGVFLTIGTLTCSIPHHWQTAASGARNVRDVGGPFTYTGAKGGEGFPVGTMEIS